MTQVSTIPYIHRYTLIRAALLISLCVVVTTATSVPVFTFERLVAESELIVDGVVSRQWAEWDGDHKIIWTRSEIAIQEKHKGSAAKVVVVNEPGGEVDGIGMSIAGGVRYKAGDRILVFLKSYPGLGYRTHGLGQGKYSVDAAGKLHADDSLRAVEITSLQAGTPQPKAGTSDRRKFAVRDLERLTLADAKRQIAAQIHQGGAQ